MATQTTPQTESDNRVQRESPAGLGRQGLSPRGQVRWNELAPELIEDAVRSGCTLALVIVPVMTPMSMRYFFNNCWMTHSGSPAARSSSSRTASSMRPEPVLA